MAYNIQPSPPTPPWAVKLMIAAVAAFITFFGLIPFLFYLTIDLPGKTEARATKNAKRWVAKSNLSAKRLSCAYDSDRDGYGSCTLVTTANERIFLQCPSGWFINLTGATGCKEIESNLKITGLAQ
jgi:hypothetical protein